MEIVSQQLTPLDILNIFSEQHRICSPLDIEADESLILTFNSTIREWRIARDLLPWKQLSEFLSESFGISVSETVWKDVLTPSRKRTLRDVCVLISTNCHFENVKPIQLLGIESLSASVFITLKKYLERRHVDVKAIMPSTEIAPYLDAYFSEMIEQIGILSKGQQIFEVFKYQSTKKYPVLEKLNTTNSAFELETGEIKTFRDLVEKIVAKNRETVSKV